MDILPLMMGSIILRLFFCLCMSCSNIEYHEYYTHLALAMLLSVAECVYVCSHGAEHVVLLLSEKDFLQLHRPYPISKLKTKPSNLVWVSRGELQKTSKRP